MLTSSSGYLKSVFDAANELHNNCMNDQKGLNSIIILGAWSMWNHRSCCVFDGISLSGMCCCNHQRGGETVVYCWGSRSFSSPRPSSTCNLGCTGLVLIQSLLFVRVVQEFLGGLQAHNSVILQGSCPLFILLNILMYSSPARLRKKVTNHGYMLAKH